MPKWMNRLIGVPTHGMPDGVPTHWVVLLMVFLKPVDKAVRSGFSEQLRDYVLSGDPLSALSRVAKVPEVAAALGLTGYQLGNASPIYSGYDSLPVPVRLRWAKLLEACPASGPSRYALQLPGGVHWPEILMMHAAGMGFQGWMSPRPVVKGLSASGIEEMLVEDGMDPSALLVSCFASPVDSGYLANHRLELVTDGASRGAQRSETLAATSGRARNFGGSGSSGGSGAEWPARAGRVRRADRLPSNLPRRPYVGADARRPLHLHAVRAADRRYRSARGLTALASSS